ncbi:DUF5683 domain-containing protein [Larkinella soli]|uniref:DUF5683 domain-containing protein n=1 Tax=Larkinella soli TaxID=1770527 RepID=UPI000FFB6AC8|nr:DUF5683 domain-containing protein [Larkinella soli]
MRNVKIGLWMVLLAGKVLAQNPAAAVRDTLPVGSSTLVQVRDSLGTPAALDTSRLSAGQEARIRKIVPRKAAIRSAILPGLGQVYNGQWWKVPIIYGGFGVMVYLANYNREQYQFFRKYAIQANYSPDKTTKVPGYTGDIPVGNLERAAKSAARYRDFNYLGMALLWGVNVIEANVTAHLKTFDISEDLSMKIEPTVLPVAGTAFPVLGVRLAFHFK